MEAKTGKIWMGTRGDACVYDGKKFTTVTNKNGKPLKNVRQVIEDKKGDIWLGGSDGLWRYDGKIFTNISPSMVVNIHEDKKGNIWTISESNSSSAWAVLGMKIPFLYTAKER